MPIWLLTFFLSAETVHACASGERKGVLVGCIIENATFLQYINQVLRENTGFIIAAAVILVVASGVQYMIALGSSGEQTKAKQRITSIVLGIIFFTLLRFIISLLAPLPPGIS
jgi:hypothetical protein